MNSSDLTLRRFFDYSHEDIPRSRLSEVDSAAALTAIRGRIRDEARGIEWPAAFGEIVKRVEDLLDPALPDIMVAAWNRYRLLWKYLDRDRYPADKTVMASLAKHTIRSDHRPSVEIMINDRTVGRVDFQVAVSLAFEGLTLRIRGGRIMEILTGSCSGSGSIACENFLLVERKTRPFELPGSIRFADGIPIAPQ